MVKLEVGKYYKTRDGRKVGPMRDAAFGTKSDGRQSWWTDSGEKIRGLEHPADIISEWVNYSSCRAAQVDVQREEYGPVRIEDYEWDARHEPPKFNKSSPIRTRREIVPGTHGVVDVICGDDEYVRVRLLKNFYTAEELREAAHLFNQLAEVLDERT